MSVDEKSNQWFGATVSSSGQDGVVVVSGLPLNQSTSTQEHFVL